MWYRCCDRHGTVTGCIPQKGRALVRITSHPASTVLLAKVMAGTSYARLRYNSYSRIWSLPVLAFTDPLWVPSTLCSLANAAMGASFFDSAHTTVALKQAVIDLRIKTPPQLYKQCDERFLVKRKKDPGEAWSLVRDRGNQVLGDSGRGHLGPDYLSAGEESAPWVRWLSRARSCR